ncbi:MFS transporter [Amycolatopsis sp. NPDC051061]|uniref:MFS transporter n=1 Tax=Amycolatopsis sp. NPDC051061 TaxID=3155042 RepID=UPI003435593B
MALLLTRNPAFRRMFFGQTLSTIGDPLLPFALAFTALADGDVATFGWLLAARSAGSLVASLAGGVIADERPPTRILALCDAARLLLVLGIGLTLVTDQHLLAMVLLFVMSAVGAVFQPTFSAALPLVVSAADLQPANSVISVAKRAGAFLGPALGGLLSQVTDVAGILAVDAATFAVSFACFLSVRTTATARRRTASFATKLREGFDAVRSRRWIWLLIVLALVQVALCMVPWMTLLPAVLAGYGHQPVAYAACLSAFAAGNVVGSLVVARIRPARPGTLAQLALLPFGLLLLVLSADLPVAAFVGVHFLAGVGLDVYTVLWVTAIQRDVPDAMRGRVFAFDAAGSSALMPVAFAVVGVLGKAVDPHPILLLGAVVGVAISVIPLVDPQVRAYASPAAASDGERDEVR